MMGKYPCALNMATKSWKRENLVPTTTMTPLPLVGVGQAQAKLGWAGLATLPSPATPCATIPFLCLPYPTGSNNSNPKPEPLWN